MKWVEQASSGKYLQSVVAHYSSSTKILYLLVK